MGFPFFALISPKIVKLRVVKSIIGCRENNNIRTEVVLNPSEALRGNPYNYYLSISKFICKISIMPLVPCPRSICGKQLRTFPCTICSYISLCAFYCRVQPAFSHFYLTLDLVQISQTRKILHRWFSSPSVFRVGMGKTRDRIESPIESPINPSGQANIMKSFNCMCRALCPGIILERCSLLAHTRITTQTQKQ